MKKLTKEDVYVNFCKIIISNCGSCDFSVICTDCPFQFTEGVDCSSWNNEERERKAEEYLKGK